MRAGGSLFAVMDFRTPGSWVSPPAPRAPPAPPLHRHGSRRGAVLATESGASLAVGRWSREGGGGRVEEGGKEVEEEGRRRAE
ncbi:unnamed protein product [Lampetra fluviatilis]